MLQKKGRIFPGRVRHGSSETNLAKQATDAARRGHLCFSRGAVTYTMKLTEALTTEHAVFRIMFDHMDRVVPELKAVAEIKLLARMAEKILCGHSEVEQNLAYTTLDHMLHEKGCLGRLSTEHQQLYACFHQVQKAPDAAESRRLLLSAIVIAREHLNYEEQVVFPLIDQTLQKESLEELGAAWKQQQAVLVADP